MDHTASIADPDSWNRVAKDVIESFVHSCLAQVGADQASAGAVTRSLVGASLRGVDSHGIRLLPHYLEVLRKGRINGTPEMKFRTFTPAAGLLDADDGFGHLAGYRAIDEGIRLASKAGIGAVSIVNSSHFGAAGSYTLAAAETGYIAMILSNSDKLVLLHDGVQPFHGTNPISFAVPVKGERPYLIDMATSSIPLNRVHHYQTIARPLPDDVAVDRQGTMTIDASRAAALLSLGGKAFGFKGAALAGFCEVLCAAISAMGFSHQLLAIHGEDLTTRRHLGHFALVMKPDLFIPQDLFDQHFAIYLNDLRRQPSAPGAGVFAPGDREWRVEKERCDVGIPIDPHLWDVFQIIAEELQMDRLEAV